MCTAIARRLAQRLRLVLERSELELERAENQATDLATTLDSKRALSVAVHRQVAESLSVLRDVVENDLENEPSLVQKIAAIEAAHMSVTEHEKDHIRIRDFYDNLVMLGDGRSFRNIDIAFAGIINVDQAVALGIFLSEFLKSNRIQEVDFEIRPVGSDWNLKLSGYNIVYSDSILIKSMALQLKGDLRATDKTVELSFPKLKVDGQ